MTGFREAFNDKNNLTQGGDDYDRSNGNTNGSNNK